MNCISGLVCRSLGIVRLQKRRWALIMGLSVVAACGIEISESADAPVKREYDAHYTLRVEPRNASVEVTLKVGQTRDLLREVRFSAPAGRFSKFDADGELLREGNALVWRPPARGGSLRWHANVNHRRGQKGYDAWLGPDWGIFRAEDLIPRATTRALKGSRSNTTFTFDLPTGWSAVTEFSGARDPVRVIRPDRRFAQPTGWMVVGDIGVRRETIAGIRVAVAGPQGQSIRRLDMLALLNWTLPELTELLPEPPARLTIVSAQDPMWRGGLSAPASLFIHADRPMISENGTSTLMHEVVHTALSLRAGENADWIVEGLAEYYSLELLRRGNAISARRYRIAVAGQAEWAAEAAGLCRRNSTGATTALAVTTLHALNREILDKTSGKRNLDDLLRHLLALHEPVDLVRLSAAATEIIGEPSDVLHIDKLPGCPTMAAAKQGD